MILNIYKKFDFIICSYWNLKLMNVYFNYIYLNYILTIFTINYPNQHIIILMYWGFMMVILEYCIHTVLCTDII